jgi:predicted transposase YdaD
MSQKSQLYTAELKGEKRGEKRGLKEGKKLGLEEEKEQTVIRGHNKGHSIDVIAEFANLSPIHVLRILQKNGLA